MSEFYLTNEGNNTYYVYRVAGEQKLDGLTLGMLTNNNIENFAPAIYTQQDSRMYIKYNVTAKITVQQLLMDVVDKKHLIAVLQGILRAVDAAEDYMIDIDTLIFDADKIFVDISTGAVAMICLPVMQEKQRGVDFRTFFKEILFSARLNPEENSNYFILLVNYLNGKAGFSTEEFLRILEEAENGTPETRREEVPRPSEQQPSSIPRQQQIPQASQQPSAPRLSAVQVQGGQPDLPPISQPAPSQSPTPLPSQEPKEMSWFYLMQHYNKENKELYREQKERKKQREKEKGKEKAKDREQKKDKKQGKKKDQAPSAPSAPMPFAVPGSPEGSGTPVPPVSPAPQPAVSQPQAQYRLQPKPSAPEAPVSGLYTRDASQGIPARRANFGETTVLNNSDMVGATTVLTQNMIPGNETSMPYLLRLKNNERILLNKPVFRIGKEKSYVDYFIGDNTAISRSHADIMKREDGYYVVDRNSTNHTYVNDRMIQSGEEVLLEDGTKVRLANEEFEFQLRI